MTKEELLKEMKSLLKDIKDCKDLSDCYKIAKIGTTSGFAFLCLFTLGETIFSNDELMNSIILNSYALGVGGLATVTSYIESNKTNNKLANLNMKFNENLKSDLLDEEEKENLNFQRKKHL